MIGKHWLISMVAVMALSACIGPGDNSGVKGQGENILPEMTGIDLLGQERTIPSTFTGKWNIVAIAFEREQQEDVNTWIPVADEMMLEIDGLKFYEVPLIYEMNMAMRSWVNNGMRAGISDPVARERTITVYTDREKFLSLMDMDTDSIYVLLVDAQGKILWRHEGIATPEAIRALRAYLSEHANID